MPKRRQQRGQNPAFAPVSAELIEVLDENARPFMIMPRTAVLSQGLAYQVVLVVVRNREGRIYLHRRAETKEIHGGLWSVSVSGFVKTGEALEDAAARELSEELGITGLPITYVATTGPSAQTDWGRINLFVSNPTNVLLNPDPAEISAGMFVDEDELAALLRDMPEMLTPALKWATSVTDLFRL